MIAKFKPSTMSSVERSSPKHSTMATKVTIIGICIFFTICISPHQCRGEIDNGDVDMSRQMQASNISAFLAQLDASKLVLGNSNNGDIEANDETDHILNTNSTKLVRISELLDIFNIEQLATLWNTLDAEISDHCSNDMVDYLNGLKSGKLWAVKMDDASGHYTSGFFYGNNYWMGSLSLCTSIYKTENDDGKVRDIKQNNGLPFSHLIGVNNAVINRHENPPFMPGFYVMKILMNETLLAPNTRTVHVGVCLPSRCSLSDVEKLAVFSQSSIQSREMKILSIRSPTNNGYNIWTDTTFIILMFVSSLVFVLLIIGTIYDIILTRRYKKVLNRSHNDSLAHSETSSGIGCTTYDLTDVVPHDLKKDLTVDIQLPHSINNNNSDEHLASECQDPARVGIVAEIILSFSAITNFNAICDRSVGSDTIPSIHGLRAISMAWVILGHTCIVVFKYSDNMELRKVVEKNFLFQAITNGAFSVDTFFFISGFLVSFIYFRTNAKGKLEKLSKGVSEVTAGTYHFLGLVGYRFVRLTAPYLFVLGVVEVTMKYLATQSVFDPPTMDHVNCPKYWWRNILYINTLFPVEDMCMLWSWYLANDTQFYIIGAIILIVGVRHLKLAASILGTFMISSWVTTAFIAFSNNHMPNTDDPLALFDKIYDKPWTRLGPYLIGMGVGWVLFKTNCKIRMTRLTVVLGWALSTGCLLLLIFGLYNTTLSSFTAAAYSSLSHSAWALSLAWITIACSTGYGGYVNSLLSASCIYPFSRVTYCAYLVHPIVIRGLALNSDAPLHLGTDSMVITFFGLVVCSYVLSFIVSMSFEAPVVTMLKIMSPNRKKRLA
ncbi:nose resistant to fluoxetine protein 6-like [Hermetia illucens]|nr:nose resistant to fluoxetine protein 6-like [Hermetia illucens]